MSSQKKPYEFKFEFDSNTQHIYARFKNAHHTVQEIEVTEELHLELTLLNRSVRNIESSEERHKEHYELSDEELARRRAAAVPSAEDCVFKKLENDELRNAFERLPDIQARRFLLIHALGFTYAEVAQMEGCSRNAIKHSLAHAKKSPKDFGTQTAQHPLGVWK